MFVCVYRYTYTYIHIAIDIQIQVQIQIDIIIPEQTKNPTRPNGIHRRGPGPQKQKPMKKRT